MKTYFLVREDFETLFGDDVCKTASYVTRNVIGCGCHITEDELLMMGIVQSRLKQGWNNGSIWCEVDVHQKWGTPSLRQKVVDVMENPVSFIQQLDKILYEYSDNQMNESDATFKDIITAPNIEPFLNPRYMVGDNPTSGKIPRIFMAGGITNCPNWQNYFIWMFRKLSASAVLYNPRRDDFDINDPHATEQQITWEYRQLENSDAILFWFPCETLCPIVLHELGAYKKSDKEIFVGVHPDYKRRKDVELQMKLARPQCKIVYSLGALFDQVYEWISDQNKPMRIETCQSLRS